MLFVTFLRPVYTIQPIVRPIEQLVEQPAASCKRGLALIPRDIQHVLTMMCLLVNREHKWSVISTVLLKLKDIYRSQTVTCTVRVLISRKRCKTKTVTVDR